MALTCDDARKLFYAKIREEMNGGKDWEEISRYLYQCELMFGKKYYIDGKYRYIDCTDKEEDLYDFLEETVVDQEGEFAYAYYFHPAFDYVLHQGHYYILSSSFYQKAPKHAKAARKNLYKKTAKKFAKKKSKEPKTLRNGTKY